MELQLPDNPTEADLVVIEKYLKAAKKKVITGKKAYQNKKTLIKFGIGFGAIILFLIIYYAILNPMVKERKAKYQDKIKK